MSDDDLEIPTFLRRTKGDAVQGPAMVYAMPISQENWQRMEQQRKAARKDKARGRVATMLARKADREAFAAGKHWDVVRGGWR